VNISSNLPLDAFDAQISRQIIVTRAWWFQEIKTYPATDFLQTLYLNNKIIANNPAFPLGNAWV
jgi:hypothetical protein